MCKFTIATLECGHPQEDHVDTYGCPYFQRSNLHCDRDNPNNKDRFTIKTWDREGICNRCLSLARKREEEAIEREQRKYDEQRRREAKEREEELRRGEREVLERGHRQAEEERLAEKRRRDEAREARLRQERAHEERVKEMEKKSKEEYDRQVRNQMERDMEYMMKQSREEALRREQEEEEEIRRALAESARLLEEERRREEERRSQEDRISSGSRDLGEDRIESWIKSTTSNTTRNHPPTMSASPPSPPATPPKLASSPPPPPPLPNAANKSAPPPPPPAPAAKVAPRPPPAPKPLTPAKEINYSLPAVGDQKIGRFRLGSRAVPIHESQDIPETPTTATKPIAPTGSAPSPMVRLGGAIPASDVPIVREIKGQVMPVPSAMEAARTGLRKPSVSRKGPPPPVPSGKDPQLEAMLAKRRAWEPEDEDTTITPPRSPSKGQSPLAGDRARRITQNEFDSKRKMGWKNADDE